MSSAVTAFTVIVAVSATYWPTKAHADLPTCVDPFSKTNADRIIADCGNGSFMSYDMSGRDRAMRHGSENPFRYVSGVTFDDVKHAMRTLNLTSTLLRRTTFVILGDGYDCTTIYVNDMLEEDEARDRDRDNRGVNSDTDTIRRFPVAAETGIEPSRAKRNTESNTTPGIPTVPGPLLQPYVPRLPQQSSLRPLASFTPPQPTFPRNRPIYVVLTPVLELDRFQQECDKRKVTCRFSHQDAATTAADDSLIFVFISAAFFIQTIGSIGLTLLFVKYQKYRNYQNVGGGDI